MHVHLFACVNAAVTRVWTSMCVCDSVCVIGTTRGQRLRHRHTGFINVGLEPHYCDTHSLSLRLTTEPQGCWDSLQSQITHGQSVQAECLQTLYSKSKKLYNIRQMYAITGFGLLCCVQLSCVYDSNKFNKNLMCLYKLYVVERGFLKCLQVKLAGLRGSYRGRRREKNKWESERNN